MLKSGVSCPTSRVEIGVALEIVEGEIEVEEITEDEAPTTALPKTVNHPPKFLPSNTLNSESFS